MQEILEIIIRAIWFILPAYFANAAPVVSGGIFPIDGGRKLSDGNRILGDGKTVEGFLFGWLVGGFFGIIQIIVWTYYGSEFVLLPEAVSWTWLVPVLLSLGALLGDLAASFFKRRFNIQRGSPVLGVDQLDLILGALLVTSPVWVPEWRIIVLLLVVTPLIHLATNRIAFELGWKSEPY